MENQNSYNMALTRNRVKYLDGQDPMYTDEQIENYRRVCNGETLEGIDQYRYFNTSWADELYRETAPCTKPTCKSVEVMNVPAIMFHSLTSVRKVCGMTKWTNYNKNYNTGHTLNRWNLRSNIDIDITKHLNVSLDLGGRIDNITQPTEGVFNLTTFGVVEANPMEPVFTPNGQITHLPQPRTLAVTLPPPVRKKSVAVICTLQ